MTAHSAFTRDQKIAIALGDLGDVPGLPRLHYVDGPNGVRGTDGATAFPSCLVLAATFDRALAERYGATLGSEVRASGGNILLGPGFDILRVPWAGRSSESFGEDPLVAGELGGHVVEGLHSERVLSIAKHYVANNFEWMRTGTGSVMNRSDAIDVRVDARTLREVYLEPFRIAVMEHGLLGLMASYNRLNGSYVAESSELLALPREEWGFRGIYAPDFIFAVRDAAKALSAGLDLPGLDAPTPDGTAGRTRSMLETIGDAQLDTIVGRIVDTIDAIGLPEPTAPEPDALGTPGSLALAEQIAIEGTTLLRNDGVLPLRSGASVALIAPDDLSHLLVTGGSASVGIAADRQASLAVELRRAGLHVRQIDPRAADIPLAPLTGADVDGGVIRITTNTDQGDDVVHELTELAHHHSPGAPWRASVRLELLAKHAGLHRLSLTFAGDAVVRLGDQEVRGFREASPMITGPEYPLQLAVDVAEGARVQLAIDYASGAALDVPGGPFEPGFRVGWENISSPFAAAIEAAGSSDVAVVVAGRVSGEAMDVDSLQLPAPQEQLIRAIAAVNPRVVVVLMNGGPVVMPWHEEVAAILHAGNPGERAGAALARILAGTAEPGGRLPFTVPASSESVPLAPGGYPGDGLIANYAEGAGVGYRGYLDGDDVAYPFGYGLGYAAFELASASTARAGSGDLTLRVRLRNTSLRSGKAVPQVYLSSPDRRYSPKLVGFAAALIEPGDIAEIEIPIPSSAFGEYSPLTGDHQRISGPYTLHVGFSSRDLRWSEELRVS